MTTTHEIESANLHHLTRSAHKIIPHLQCASAAAIATFYTAHLHFVLGDLVLNNDPPMASVFMGRRAEANIYIFETPHSSSSGAHEPVSPGTVMIGLGKAELEAYYAALVAEGSVEIVHEISDRPWGFRQFDVKDLDGNVLQFFAFMSE